VNEAAKEDLTLNDLFQVLRRQMLLILGLPIGLGLAALIASFLLPKTYTTTVVVSLNLANQTTQQGLLNNLPSLPGLAQGFVDLQNTTLLTQDLKVDDPTRFYQARFDSQKGLLNLRAEGTSPQEARDRAERILNVARNYLRERMVEGAQSNIRAALTQTQLDLQVAKDGLRRIQAQLQSTTSRSSSNETIAAGLEARGNDPQAARTVNPGVTSLSLDESRLRSEIAKSEARIDTLTKFLNQPEQINQLVGQALLVQVLVPPAEPLRATFPRPVLFTAVAAVLGLLIGLLWAFIAEAVRPRP
jgi:LPS O-antigen subunit length determinant protein (WzzB/FepE family)